MAHKTLDSLDWACLVRKLRGLELLGRCLLVCDVPSVTSISTHHHSFKSTRRNTTSLDSLHLTCSSYTYCFPLRLAFPACLLIRSSSVHNETLNLEIRRSGNPSSPQVCRLDTREFAGLWCSSMSYNLNGHAERRADAREPPSGSSRDSKEPVRRPWL